MRPPAVRYIFSINAGRSGSEYLSQLLAHAAGVSSVHEGVPICCGAPMVEFNDGEEGAMRRLMALKMRSIHATRHAMPVYAETNHTFIKGFGLLLPDNYIAQEDMGVVILRRGVEETAASFLRLHEIPGLRHGNNWWLKPTARRNILPAPPADAHPFEFCKWYVREVYARGEMFRRRFPRITYFESTLSALNDPAVVGQMLDTFGLEATEGLAAAVGSPTNLRDEFPRLPLAELLAPCPFPSADALPPREQDELLQRVVGFVFAREGAALRQLHPAAAEVVRPTLAREVFQLYSKHLRDMEEAFRVRIMFTDMVHTAGREILHAIHPEDLMFTNAVRRVDPTVHFEDIFNDDPAETWQRMQPAGGGAGGWTAGEAAVALNSVGTAEAGRA
eukprot:TRINITY_DN12939_c0_g2_i1.p1 TRINITY_DN12939_c0_g2~~TRINITY_DN12939_c0_g2_i1.p1  ORF type:complete len:390 (+),score=113.38 TRINITY_DN12939_c0_g2_i1:121-1290(+)